MQILFLVICANEDPKDLQADIRNIENWPAFNECAWMVWSDQDPEEIIHMKVDDKEGVSEMLDALIDDLEFCDLLVTHDIALDNRILTAAMLRNKKRLRSVIAKRGTKYQGRLLEYCPSNFWDYKWPSLAWIYEELFEAPIVTGKDLSADVIALKDCFLEMKNRGVVEID